MALFTFWLQLCKSSLRYLMRAFYQSAVTSTVIILMTIGAFFVGCGGREFPPFFTARVVDLYDQTTIVTNLKILYTWEERGETPFLKPYSYYTKELIVEVMQPVPGEPRRVTIETKKIPLTDIQRVTFIREEVGMHLNIDLKNGDRIIATDRFPQVLKRGEKTGFADYNIYVVGTTVKDAKPTKFTCAWDMLKQFEIVTIAETL